MYQERIKRVLDSMEEMGLDQMLVSDPDSIWYLTGYDVFPFERLFAFYLRRDGHHKLFLNRLFPVPEAPYEQVWSSDTDDAVAILPPIWMEKAPWGSTRSGRPGSFCP